MATSLNIATAPEATAQGEFVGRWLSGSQRKTAFALRANAERLVREDGLNSIGFLTLTVGDYEPKNEDASAPSRDAGRARFVQVKDAAEASRRINNLNRRLLSALFERAIIVTERHRSGAIHFHVLGTVRGRPDIRTGLDFEAIRRRDYRTAPKALREIWAMLRAKLPGYGFGRAELLPIRKTGAAVAAYVAKYIEKNVCARGPEDRRKKLVRYLGWNGQQLKPNEFEWNTPRAIAWRAKAAELCALVNVRLGDSPHVKEPEAIVRTEPELRKRIRPRQLDGADAAEFFGPRWAWLLTRIIAACNDSITNFVIWDNFHQKQAVRMELARWAEESARKRERDAYYEAWARAEMLADLACYRESIQKAVPVTVEAPPQRSFAVPVITKPLAPSLAASAFKRATARSERRCHVNAVSAVAETVAIGSEPGGIAE